MRIVARHVGRGLIEFADLDAAHGPPVAELTLVPECRISGKIVCPELAKLGRKVGWTNVYLDQGQSRLMASDSEGGDFHLVVPPGRYKLRSYGTYLSSTNETVTVPAGKHEMEFTVTLLPKTLPFSWGTPRRASRDCRLEERAAVETGGFEGEVRVAGVLGLLVRPVRLPDAGDVRASTTSLASRGWW